MRTVKNLPAEFAKNTDYTKFPDSSVVNEVDGVPDSGTPVVEEIYGDVLVNLYKIIRMAGLTPNQVQDNEVNGHQLVAALKLFSNAQNDVQQALSLSGSVFTVSLNLSILPDKYVCVARAAAAYVVGNSYTLRGNGEGEESYAFTSASAFATGDVVLLIIDQTGARGYNLSNSGGLVPTETFTPFGIPLAFNNGAKVWYQAEGILYSDLPEAYDLQGAIRLLESDGTILVYEMMIIAGFALCLSFNPNTLVYKLYKFDLAAPSTPILMTISGTSFPTGVDRKPNIYTNGSNLYVSNGSGNSANNYSINIYTLNIAAGTATYTGNIALDAAFEKTTNAVVKGGFLYTFVRGQLVKYNLGTGVRTFVNAFPGYIGVLFGFNGEAYYSNGEVAKKWAL